MQAQRCCRDLIRIYSDKIDFLSSDLHALDAQFGPVNEKRPYFVPASRYHGAMQASAFMRAMTQLFLFPLQGDKDFWDLYQHQVELFLRHQGLHNQAFYLALWRLQDFYPTGPRFAPVKIL